MSTKEPVTVYGFSKAPVSRFLLLSLSSLTSLSSYFGFFPSLTSLHSLNQSLGYLDIYQFHQLHRFFLSKWIFSSTQEWFAGGLLIFHFRIVERLYGSRKYMYFWMTTTLATLLEWGTMCILKSFGISLSIPIGPYPMLFATLYAFQHCTPITMNQERILGVLPASFHAWIYILSLNLFVQSWPSMILPALCGYVSGAFYVHILSTFSFFRNSKPSSALRFKPISAPSVPAPSVSSTPYVPNQETIDTLKSMGFEENKIMHVLQRVNGNMEQAIQALLD